VKFLFSTISVGCSVVKLIRKKYKEFGIKFENVIEEFIAPLSLSSISSFLIISNTHSPSVADRHIKVASQAVCVCVCDDEILRDTPTVPEDNNNTSDKN